jgi:Zn-dependent protease with chaperone function
MSNYSFSFVWGFWRSKLILSTGLLHTLTAEELRGLLEHEAAHHERRDNLIKLALSFCTYTSLAIPFTRLLLRWRSLEVERFCDEIAASRTNAPLDIASALVKLRRRASPTPLAASSFVADSSSSFHLRVSRLIDSVNESSFIYSQSVVRRRQIWSTATYALIFISSLLVSTYLSPFAFHQRAESLIQLFK